MPIKLVIFDLDGTLSEPDFTLLPELREKLKGLKELGIKLAIVTGRDPLGSLYFIHRADFPFDYLGTGGGGIILDPLNKRMVIDLFRDKETIESIMRGGSKTDRIIKIQELCGVTDKSETLLIDDNPHPDKDIIEIPEKVNAIFACPQTNNNTWRNIIAHRREAISVLPCGYGVLDILKMYSFELKQEEK